MYSLISTHTPHMHFHWPKTLESAKDMSELHEIHIPCSCILSRIMWSMYHLAGIHQYWTRWPLAWPLWDYNDHAGKIIAKSGSPMMMSWYGNVFAISGFYQRSLPVTGGFPSSRASNANPLWLLCFQHDQAAPHTIEYAVISGAMMLMLRYCNTFVGLTESMDLIYIDLVVTKFNTQSVTNSPLIQPHVG